MRGSTLFLINSAAIKTKTKTDRDIFQQDVKEDHLGCCVCTRYQVLNEALLVNTGDLVC